MMVVASYIFTMTPQKQGPIERAKQHHERRITRSQTLNAVDNIVPRDISEPEFVRSSDNDLFSDTRNPGLVSPVLCAVEPTSALDPLVSPFTPASPQLARSDHVSYPDIESASLDSVTSSLPCSRISDPDGHSVDERGSLRFHLDAAVITDDRYSIHSTASVYVDGLAVVSKVGLGNGKPGCQNYSCMYGGGLSRDDIDYIYKCLKCEGPHTSSLCAKCMLNGGCCEPGHDNWELITWSPMTTNVVLILNTSKSATDNDYRHSWYPEWWTAVLFFFIIYHIFVYMGSICYVPLPVEACNKDYYYYYYYYYLIVSM